MSTLSKNNPSQIFQTAHKPILSINLSAKSVSSPEMLEYILLQIKEYHYPPDHIIFEITEQSSIKNINTTIKFINCLSGMGVRFALDDFGIGFSSLSMLKKLPIHFLKIDKSLLEGAENDTKSLKMLEHISAMAKALNIEVILEGVETFLAYRIAKKLKIDYCQGYLFGIPQMELDQTEVKPFQVIS
ncbi:MAG: EAL domain-containing protein [Thiolinea sp.]